QEKRTRISLVWIIPIAATVVGLWVAVTRIRSEGPKITIVFESAEGLEAGKTKINYRGVDVGTITGIQLSQNHQRVIATAQMAPDTEKFLVADTQLWVVRPRISGANVPVWVRSSPGHTSGCKSAHRRSQSAISLRSRHRQW